MKSKAKQTLSFLAKYSTWLILSLLFATLTFGAFVYQTQIPQETIRKLVQKELSRQFKREVTIDRVSGNLLFSATLKGIRFADKDRVKNGVGLEIGELTAHYNLISAVQHNGDFAAASSKVMVKNVILFVHRQANDDWNVFHFFPPPEPHMPPGVPTFTGILFVNNLAFKFQDDKGWGETQLQKPFTETFGRFKGSFNFSHLKRVQLSLTGETASNEAPMTLQGVFNAFNGQYDLMFSLTPKLDRWAPYVLPYSGFSITQESPFIVGHVKSKELADPAEIPFWYDLTVHLDNNTLKLAAVPLPITQLKADVHLYNNQLDPLDLNAVVSAEEATSLISRLKALRVLNQDGRLLRYKLAELKDLPLWKSLLSSEQQKAIVHRLVFSKGHIDIQSASGKVDAIPLQAQGSLYAESQSISLNIKAKAFDLEALKRVFPALNRYTFSGRGESQFRLNGRLDDPKISGALDLYTAEIYTVSVPSAKVHFEFGSSLFQFKTDPVACLSGQAKIEGRFYTTGANNMSLTATGQHLSVADLGLRQIPISGFADVNLTLTQGQEGYTVAFKTTLPDVRLYQQNLQHLSGTLLLRPDDSLIISGLDLGLNDTGVLHLSGSLQPNNAFTLQFQGQGIPLKDVDPTHEHNKSGLLTLKGQLSGVLNQAFWANPWENLQGSVQSNLTDYRFFEQPIDTLDLDLSFANHSIVVREFRAKHGPELLAITGDFEGLEPRSISVVVQSLNLNRSKWIQRQLPDVIKPFGGDISAKLSITKKSRPGTAVANWHWMGRYAIQGQASLTHTLFQSQPLSTLNATLNWDGNALTLSDAMLKHGKSTILLAGRIQADQRLDLTLRPGSVVVLDDFPVLTSSFGYFSGQVAVDGRLSGTWRDPDVELNIVGKQLHTNHIVLDEAVGKIVYNRHKLSSPQFTLKRGDNDYGFSGYIDLSPLLFGRNLGPQAWDYKLSVGVNKADLGILSELIESIYKEVKSHREAPAIATEAIPNANTTPATGMVITSPLQKDPLTPLYSLVNTGAVSAYYQALANKKTSEDNPEELGLKNLIRGSLSGTFVMESHQQLTPTLTADLSLTDASISFLSAQKLELTIHSDGSGTQWTLGMDNGRIGAKDFQNFSGNGTFDQNGVLFIQKGSITADQRPNPRFLQGRIPLAGLWDKTRAEDLMSVEVVLEGNNISVLTLFNDTVKDITNDGRVVLDIGGSLAKPLISAREITLKNAAITFSEDTYMRSPLRIAQASLTLVNNHLMIPATTIEWRGIDTKFFLTAQERLNTFVVSGAVDFNDLTLIDPEQLRIGLDLALQDTFITLNFPKVYNGDVKLSNIRVKGIYTVGISDTAKLALRKQLQTERESGPVISGYIELSTGEVILPSVGSKTLKPPFMLDLTCMVRSSIYVGGSLLGEGFFEGVANSFNLALNETSDPLLVGGTINAPRIRNKITFSDGGVNLFNRGFDLLTTDRQRLFYSEQYRIHPNTLSFVTRTEKNSEKLELIPMLDIVAISVIPPYQKSSTVSDNTQVGPKPADTYKAVLVSFNGSVYNLDTIAFEEYNMTAEDPFQGSPKYQNTYTISGSSGASKDLSSVVRLLFPNLVQSSTDSQEAEGDQKTKRIINEVGENQINTLVRRQFLRPIEKQIAKNVGLYDLRVDYNVGGALLKQVSNVSGYSGLGSDQNNVAVNMISQLSEPLFLRVRTDFDSSADNRVAKNALRVSEVELTYYLLRNLTVNYANIQDPVDLTIRPKVSVKYSYEF
ncbi:MAG: hypothetical protein AB7F28_01660 [Candidatus Margulisiibacteriota bacterium]